MRQILDAAVDYSVSYNDEVLLRSCPRRVLMFTLVLCSISSVGGVVAVVVAVVVAIVVAWTNYEARYGFSFER